MSKFSFLVEIFNFHFHIPKRTLCVSLLHNQTKIKKNTYFEKLYYCRIQTFLTPFFFPFLHHPNTACTHMVTSSSPLATCFRQNFGRSNLLIIMITPVRLAQLLLAKKFSGLGYARIAWSPVLQIYC